LSLGQSQEELDEEEEERKRMEAEAEIQRVKARQAFLDNLAVMVAMTSIVILAVVIVILKSVMFPDDKIITFIPLPQQVKVCLQYGAYESAQFNIACSKESSIRFLCPVMVQTLSQTLLRYYGRNMCVTSYQ
jgi:hypothetical protein